MIALKLKETELNLIYELLKERQREGSYYGNKEMYYKRLNTIITKVESASTAGERIHDL